MKSRIEIDKLQEIANKIIQGGITVIIVSPFREAKCLFMDLMALLPESTFSKFKRQPDVYELKNENWSLYALPATDRLCGYRFDNLIFNDLVPMEIILPMKSVNLKKLNTWQINLNEDERRN